MSRVAARGSRRAPEGMRRAGGLPLGAAALVVSLAATVWLALAGVAPPAPGPSAPAEEASAVPAASVPDFEPLAVAPAPAEPASGDDAPGAGVVQASKAARPDDVAPGVDYWPLVAPDPEREADAESPESARAVANDVHVVAEGETLLGIALSVGVDEDRLAELNGLADRDRLAVGQRLLVPPGRGEPARPVVTSRGATLRPRLVWPHTGEITTEFNEYGALWIGFHHTGLDIAGREGDPVVAAEAGRVLEAGWAETRGFGNYVLLDHGLGYQTLYGHLSAIRVKPGQQVSRGQRIGDVGNTGVSTGPHLHFEVRLDGQPIDPLKLLP